MQIGAVIPHNEIGTDPEAIKAYARGIEAMGLTHVLLYDHVLGADPNRKDVLPRYSSSNIAHVDLDTMSVSAMLFVVDEMVRVSRQRLSSGPHQREFKSAP